MEKRIQILVGFSARRNIGDFCHPRGHQVPEIWPESHSVLVVTQRELKPRMFKDVQQRKMAFWSVLVHCLSPHPPHVR